MGASVEELRQLVDSALAAGAAVDDDAEAAGRAVAALGQLAVQQVGAAFALRGSHGRSQHRNGFGIGAGTFLIGLSVSLACSRCSRMSC